MKLKDLISTLRTVQYEKVEIRDEENNALFVSPTTSDALKPYLGKRVIEWFPHGAAHSEATFTVLLKGR